MDEPTRRDAIQRYVEATDRDIAHEIFHDDAILEFPQSQEMTAAEQALPPDAAARR